MKKLSLIFLLTIVFAVCIHAKERIKVACVGNSVTYGYKIPDREQNCYPVQLQRMMGNDYDVRNFGHSGATMTHRSPMWYMGLPEYKQAIEFKADIVVIHLGLNDTDPRWWPNYSEEFIPDYRALIDSFRVANPKAKIYICLMTPIGHQHHRFQSGTRDWHEQIQHAIRQVATGAHVGLIDLFTPFYNRPDLFPDALHPDAEGAGILARTVYQNITGDFGGLQMPLTYSDNMVLQRDKPLDISGVANAGEKVQVTLTSTNPSHKLSIKRQAKADAWGKWSVSMPQQPKGGPLKLEISTTGKTLIYNNVYMGDVWLCSGQSNMEFKLGNCATRATDLVEAPAQGRIHLLNLQAIAATSATEWPDTILKQVNDLKYLTTPGWQTMGSADVKNMSAIAYHFGKMLTDSLDDLHIGLVCNPVGGTPAEAWIDRWTLQYEYPQILYDWLRNDHIQQWVRERGAQNIKQSTNPLQRHPYEPCYMFESGIQPLQHMSLKGALWYQGESNAHNTELHERLFPLMLKSWRKWFGDEQLPFYFVQLSSLNRPSWPRFRNSQRLMAEQLPNVWMAVSSDLGDSLDVHPTRKKEVGQRLALQALCHSYNRPALTSQGPTVSDARLQGTDIVVTFTNARQLKSADNQPLRGFEVAGPDGIYLPASATIQGNHLSIHIDRKHFTPTSVRYGWQPFTRANLVNESLLPASTFQVEVK